MPRGRQRRRSGRAARARRCGGRACRRRSPRRSRPGAARRPSAPAAAAGRVPVSPPMKPQRTGSAPSSAAIRATQTPWPAACRWMSSPPSAGQRLDRDREHRVRAEDRDFAGLPGIDGRALDAERDLCSPSQPKAKSAGWREFGCWRLGGDARWPRRRRRVRARPRGRWPTAFGPAARPGASRSRAGGAGPADPALLERPHLRHALRARPLFLDASGAAVVACGAACRRAGSRLVRRARAAVLRDSARGRGERFARARGLERPCCPRDEEIASLVVCEDDARDPGAALRPPRRRPLRRDAGAERLGRAAPLPLQPARPAAARPRPARRLRASTSCARSARPTASTSRFDPRLPVIVLTGRGADAERVRGLESGADDYVVKPFHYRELRARIGAVLRRRAGRREGPMPGRRAGRRPGAPQGLGRRARGRRSPTRSSRLLRVLAADPTRVFTKARAARGGLGLPHPGADPDARLARQPAAAQTRPRARPLRRQLLGRRIPADRRVTSRASRDRWPLALTGGRRGSRASAPAAGGPPSTRRCTSCAGRCRRSPSPSAPRPAATGGRELAGAGGGGARAARPRRSTAARWRRVRSAVAVRAAGRARRSARWQAARGSAAARSSCAGAPAARGSVGDRVRARARRSTT